MCTDVFVLVTYFNFTSKYNLNLCALDLHFDLSGGFQSTDLMYCIEPLLLAALNVEKLIKMLLNMVVKPFG